MHRFVWGNIWAMAIMQRWLNTPGDHNRYHCIISWSNNDKIKPNYKNPIHQLLRTQLVHRVICVEDILYMFYTGHRNTYIHTYRGHTDIQTHSPTKELLTTQFTGNIQMIHYWYQLVDLQTSSSSPISP